MTFGCHPRRAYAYDAMARADLLRLLAHPKTVAVGEIGLDLFPGVAVSAIGVIKCAALR